MNGNSSASLLPLVRVASVASGANDPRYQETPETNGTSTKSIVTIHIMITDLLESNRKNGKLFDEVELLPFSVEDVVLFPFSVDDNVLFPVAVDVVLLPPFAVVSKPSISMSAQLMKSSGTDKSVGRSYSPHSGN
jgi:hypothetical protein